MGKVAELEKQINTKVSEAYKKNKQKRYMDFVDKKNHYEEQSDEELLYHQIKEKSYFLKVKYLLVFQTVIALLLIFSNLCERVFGMLKSYLSYASITMFSQEFCGIGAPESDIILVAGLHTFAIAFVVISIWLIWMVSTVKDFKGCKENILLIDEVMVQKRKSEKSRNI